MLVLYKVCHLLVGGWVVEVQEAVVVVVALMVLPMEVEVPVVVRAVQVVALLDLTW